MKDFVKLKQQANFGRLYVVFGGLVAFLAFVTISARFAPRPSVLMADSTPRCANKKLPSYFVSDANVVRRLGGKPSLYAGGAPENFGLGSASPGAGPSGDGSTPTGETPASAMPAGGAYGDGSIGMTTVERPDAGTLLLAVAQNEADREKGLMCVTKMAPRVGMIFVFSSETVENFWMKDTLIPLDMIFVSGNGRVNAVAANVPPSRLDQPDTTVARRSGLGRYVIELNAGEAARDAIKPGVRLEIPHLVSMD